MTLPQAPIPAAYPAAPLAYPLYGATPWQAIVRFFKKYATFSGRASRSEYLWVALFEVVGLFVILFAAAIVGNLTQTNSDRLNGQPGVGFFPFAILWILFALAIIVPSIALTVRRLHDANFSGLMYLLVLVPYLGHLIVFILALMPSRPEGARYDI